MESKNIPFHQASNFFQIPGPALILLHLVLILRLISFRIISRSVESYGIHVNWHPANPPFVEVKFCYSKGD
jgi:hypothetical protein